MEIKELVKISKTLKLLYVEDDKDSRDATLDVLDIFFENITIAIDGLSGLDAFSKDHFDIIITDINQIKDYRVFFKDNFNKNSYSDPKKIYVGERIVTFLVKDIKLFNHEDGYCFYEYVRNGLIHEGRVKCGCYLDNTIEDVVQKTEGVLKFNPNIVVQELESWLKYYFKNVEKGKDTYEKLRDYIKKILDEDLEAIEKRDKNDKFPCKK